MYRYALEKLKAWKNSKERRPLVIYGARQVGKTWLMKEFGRKNYDSFAYVSFEENSIFKKIFEKDLNISRIISELSLAINLEITAETLIIFDEVQECPKALTSLKYFSENAPACQIMAAGSLLGVMSLEGTGFPVGKVDLLTIYPMSFYEFLAAVDNRFLPALQSLDFKTLEVFHDEIIGLMKQYFYVGGMPAAVKKYLEAHNFLSVREIQRQIIDSYYADFAKHIPVPHIAKTREIWESIPIQLAKENKRFLYSDMKKGSRGRNYEIALNWLTQTNLIHKLYRVSSPNMPLIGYRQENIFKIYMSDIGLLSAKIGIDPETYLGVSNKTFLHYKGGLAEQFVFQELIAADDKVPIYYWATDKNTAEIEFILQYRDIIPIEVKSGKNVKSESLDVYRKVYAPAQAVRTSLKKYAVTNGLYSLPLYMSCDIKSLIGK